MLYKIENPSKQSLVVLTSISDELKHIFGTITAVTKKKHRYSDQSNDCAA